jgi:nicotinate-nucleotide pyrophosphorylase
MKALSAFRLLLLASWLGAAVFFIAVAQSAFAVIPSREVAGGLVGRNLAILNYIGIGISIIALLTSLIASAGTNRILLWAERVLLIVFGLACAIAQFVAHVVDAAPPHSDGKADRRSRGR